MKKEERFWLRKKNDYATVRGHVRDCSLGAQGILLVEQFDVEFQNTIDSGFEEGSGSAKKLHWKKGNDGKKGNEGNINIF